MEKPSCVALIPARSGSKRIADKNIRNLGGHPLVAYSICAARDSGVFDAVVVATDSEIYADVARKYYAEVPFLRGAAISGDTSPDIEWVRLYLDRLRAMGRVYDCFSILRPTSPFRKMETIRRAWNQFIAQERVDSLRAVEKCGQHPGKMWVINKSLMTPLLPFQLNGQPWHSNQYAALPEIHVQNASLEIAWTRVVYETGTISGYVLAPFFTEGAEGFDLNEPYDWQLAEKMLEQGQASLPEIRSVDVLNQD